MEGKIHFIINPISGKRKGLKFYEYLQSIRNENFILKISSFPGEAIELSKQSVKEKAATIVSCGGDGTLREVASQLVHTNIPLGIIPIGSGNGLARNLKIPLKPEDALQYLLKAKPQFIDVGKVNNEYFFSNVGIGIDSEIINEFSSQNLRGLLGYIKSSAITIFKFKPIKLKIITENFECTKYFFLANVANANQIGYNFTFSPNALLQDGKLNMLLVERFNFFGFFRYGVYFITRNLKNFSAAQSFETKKLTIRVLSDVENFQIDGDKIPLEEKELKISVLEKALRVLV